MPVADAAAQRDAEPDVAALRDFIRAHPRLFVLTGAGVSTASGIPDYRDASGAWKTPQRPPIQFQAFVSDAAARRRYWARSQLGWPRFAAAAPNPAHIALTRLQRAGRVLQLVTQNVDRLHQRAGSDGVIDLHGRLDRARCLDCDYRQSRQALQIWLEQHNPWLRDAGGKPDQAPDGDARLAADVGLDRYRIPACPRCQGIVKPDVVFFGENVPKPRVELALRQLDAADALLAVGTSLTVYSGYRFCRAAVDRGVPLAAVNLGSTRADALFAVKLSAPCGDALTALTAALER